MLDSSCGEAGGWLETAATSGVDDVLVPLRVWAIPRFQWLRRRERGRVRLERGTGVV
jgi:hypothetical protein